MTASTATKSVTQSDAGKNAPSPEPTHAPAPLYSDLAVADAAPLVITRARKPRELTALAAALKASHAAWKVDKLTGTKQITVPDQRTADRVKLDIVADAKQLGISASVKADKQADGSYLVRFQGRDKRTRTTT